MDEYLALLQQVCEQLNRSNRTKQVFLALAAAVSDFVVPDSERPYGKISVQPEDAHTAAPITYLPLQKIPSSLHQLVMQWLSDQQSMFVTVFKLVTTAQDLDHEAERLLEHSKADAVIGNYLNTRRSQCTLYLDESRTTGTKTDVLTKEQAGGAPIERLIVSTLLKEAKKKLEQHEQKNVLQSE